MMQLRLSSKNAFNTVTPNSAGLCDQLDSKLLVLLEILKIHCFSPPKVKVRCKVSTHTHSHKAPSCEILYFRKLKRRRNFCEIRQPLHLKSGQEASLPLQMFFSLREEKNCPIENLSRQSSRCSKFVPL